VKGIEVETNEGGVTKYVGGCRIIVIPAGYVGGAFWGGFFVALSGSRIGATGTFLGKMNPSCSLSLCAFVAKMQAAKNILNVVGLPICSYLSF